MKRKTLKIAAAGLFVLSMFFIYGGAAKALAQSPEIFVQLGHSDSVKSAVFTSDGKYLLSGGEDKAVKIWETTTGKELRTLRQHDKISAFALSPDNKTILISDEKGNLSLWDITTGKILGKFTGKTQGAANTIAISPDGRHAVSANLHALAYWNINTKKQIFALERQAQIISKGFQHHAKAASFLADSGKIVLATETINKNHKTTGFNIEIYDVQKRKTVKEYNVLKGETHITSFAVSPNEKYYFVSLAVVKPGSTIDSTGRLLVVDAATGKIVKDEPSSELIFNVSFSPRGDYAAAANYGEVIVYETKNWREIKRIAGVRLPVIFSPDGQSILYGNTAERAYYGENVHINGLDMVDLQSWQRIRRFSGNVNFVTSGRFLAEGREIVSPHWLFLYWDREKGALGKTLTLTDAANRKVNARWGNPFSPDASRAIVGNDYGSYLGNLQSGKLKKIIDGWMTCVDFGADGQTILFTTSDRKVILWDVENNSLIRQLADWSGRGKLYMRLNKLSPDGKFALAAFQDYDQEGDETILIWNAQTGREVNKITMKNSIHSLDFSPDGKHLLTGEYNGADNGHEILLRSIANRKIIKKFKGHKDIISALAFSPDGKFLLSGSWDQNIILWNAENGQKIKTFAGHTGIIYSLAFSRDLKYFVSTSNDGTMRLWDIESGREVAQFISFIDGEWIVITPEGYFNASQGGAKHLSVRLGNRVFPIDNLYEKFFNPVYVASVLQGKKAEGLADIRQGIKPPPEVRIVSPKPDDRFNTDTITIKVAARDTGGGIDEIRLFHNGKALGDDQRGVKIVGTGAEKTRDFTVTLVDGLNTFRAVGFSSDRTESNPYEISVQLAAPSKDVSLYVFAVGVNKYKNPTLNLNYAVPDAKGIAGFFRQKGQLFKQVNIIEIYDEEATKEGILAKLKELTKTNPQDAVLLYLAGHGESVKDVWYFIPHELTYPEREEHVQTKGISSAELAAAMKNIPAQKILMLVDACKSGAVLVAFRGFEDRKALSQLSRSTGTHVVAASTKDQFAAEVKDLGHGVFTYTLLEGLKGKAAGGGDTVTVRKLMGYIEEQLPEITKKYKQEAQFPVVDSRGMDFPLVTVK